MGKRKRVIFIVAGIAALAAAGGTLWGLAGSGPAASVEAVSRDEVDEARGLLQDSLKFQTVRYQDYIAGRKLRYDLEGGVWEPEAGEKETGYDGTVRALDYLDSAEYVVEAKREGLYSLGLDYRTGGSNLSDYRMDVTVNGERYFEEMSMITLPLLWEDGTKEFPLDRYGDETAPAQLRYEGWQYRDLYNTSYYQSDPLYFWLEQGENRIRVQNASADGLTLGRLYVNAPDGTIPSYEEYQKQHSGEPVSDAFLEINSVDYVRKNSTAALTSSVNNPSLQPHDSEYKKLNVVSWKKAGVEVTYDVEAEETGLYRLAMHYRNEKEDFQVFESIYIDGRIPFREFRNYGFDTTDTSWKNEILSDEAGNPYLVWLTAGPHTLTIRSETEPVSEEWHYARLIAEHVSQFSLEIKKITGAEVDEYRTWSMTRYIPDTLAWLEAYETLIRSMQSTLQEYAPNGVDSAKLSELDRALGEIEKLKEYPDEIALHTDNLDSLLKLMGDFASNISAQPFALDRIYVGGQKLPRENAGFFASVGNGIENLAYTFLSDKYRMENDEEAVNIWVNRSVTQADLLQKMADSDFTEKTGIKVKISVMPDAGKLTMAVAAGEMPDMALGLASHAPFELACRDAVYDLTRFEDFWQVADRFAPGAFVPYVFNERVYGIPETADFNMVIYRKDIFQKLEIPVPGTWEELIGILPVLQHYGMNFYHNIATMDGYKWFYQTTPMIYQNGGSLYTEDGMHTAIDQAQSAAGIKALGELFAIYSVPTQVSQFMDSFRYGILPIGIVGLETYNLIANGAPELEGQWGLAPYLGTVQEDGSIDRSYIAAGTGGLIFANTKKADEAWAFLKWWLDHEVQAEYAHTLQSTYGSENIWLPANLEAIGDCALPTEHKLAILEQLSYLRDVPRTPGQYMLERDLSNIWNGIAVDGKAVQPAIDEKILEINREITKKMTDLGYLDNEGNLLREYNIRDVDWIRENIEAHREGGEQ